MAISTRALANLIRGRPAGRLPKPEPPRIRRLERAYAARINVFLQPYREAVEQELFPELEIAAHALKPRVDDAVHTLARIFGRIRARIEAIITDRAIERLAGEAAMDVTSENRSQFRRTMRTVLNVDPLMAEPWLEDAMRVFVSENASLIKTLPTEAIADIEQMVLRDGRRGLSPQQIRAKIYERFDVTRSRAQLIARDQVAKFNGSLTELRQRELGIGQYIWRTAEDERVRLDHARLDGRTFSWNQPPITVTSGKRAGERNHPGQDIQCRCYAEPVLDELLR